MLKKIRKQKNKEILINKIKENLMNSNIDFSKFGWVSKASK